MLAHEGLQKLMQKFIFSERLTHMVRQLHDSMMVRVTVNRAVSEAFAVTNEVNQGCVLAPLLFSVMFSVMLVDAYHEERPRIRIAHGMEGQLLNQRWTHFQLRHKAQDVHWLTGRRIRLRAPQHDLVPITHTPGFTYSGDMEEPSPTIHLVSTSIAPICKQLTLSPYSAGRSPRSIHRITKASQTFFSYSKHRLESTGYPLQHKAQDVQSCHLADAAVWSRDLDWAPDAVVKAQPLPP
ncbi:unnamed protein product [Schistocephalus solidus]|uniref:Reverse transcriptase domain-containing protein n=1 Tax=Schistocephalus solidus TaxID=70667 RepID=A0A183TN87_SCHSO|nr:unnamed protein product [Schistocephalus solidus]